MLHFEANCKEITKMKKIIYNLVFKIVYTVSREYIYI